MDDQNGPEGDARAYINGAPGVLISGLVWLTAGYVWSRDGVPAAFAVLFFGGMLIMPLAMIISRTVLRAPKLGSGHPLERLGLESNFLLFAGILVVYAALRVATQSVFPILATTIGARYFAQPRTFRPRTFATCIASTFLRPPRLLRRERKFPRCKIRRNGSVVAYRQGNRT